MIEFVLIAGLLLVARRLRRVSRTPPPPIRIDVHLHVHYPDGPGEQQPANRQNGEEQISDNIAPFRRRA